ncbi:hypothetical protein SprV_0702324200 [Sparganum proliferum]
MELTEEQMQVLRRDASFNTVDAKPANMTAAVESMFSQTGATDETTNLIPHQVSSLLMAHRPYDVLSKVERDALKELRVDNDLVIVPADKGRSTVVKGTPTGSPISGLIAEAVLQRLESLVFRHDRPKFWARCVDGTFVVIERYQVLKFKEHLNAVFPDIQFTMEEEENNQLAFLDVLVCLERGDNRVSRELPESCFSGPQSINKNSHLPVPYSMLRFSLGRGISHVGRARATNYPSDSEPIC